MTSATLASPPRAIAGAVLALAILGVFLVALALGFASATVGGVAPADAGAAG